MRALLVSFAGSGMVCTHRKTPVQCWLRATWNYLEVPRYGEGRHTRSVASGTIATPPCLRREARVSGHFYFFIFAARSRGSECFISFSLGIKESLPAIPRFLQGGECARSV